MHANSSFTTLLRGSRKSTLSSHKKLNTSPIIITSIVLYIYIILLSNSPSLDASESHLLLLLGKAYKRFPSYLKHFCISRMLLWKERRGRKNEYNSKIEKVWLTDLYWTIDTNWQSLQNICTKAKARIRSQFGLKPVQFVHRSYDLPATSIPYTGCHHYHHYKNSSRGGSGLEIYYKIKSTRGFNVFLQKKGLFVKE